MSGKTIENRLPPIERELSGKSLEQLLDLGNHYIDLYNQLLENFTGARVSMDAQRELDSLRKRISTIEWETRMAWAKSIMNDPNNATPEQIRRAKQFVWNYQVNQLISGAVPSDFRAQVVQIDGTVAPPPSFLSLKDAYEYDRLISNREFEAIADGILCVHPDPDGKIWTIREMNVIQIIDS